jgi:large subunit ribosomal protein L23
MGIFDIFKKKPAKKAKPVKVRPPEAKKIPARRPIPKRKDVREIYKILVKPHVSEKATYLSDEGRYTFEIYPRANKIQVRNAVSNLYGVKVKDVNIVNIKAKKRILRGMEGHKPGYKKAIVTLEKGEKIEILPH